VGWGIPNPANGTLLILQISVSIKDLFRFDLFRFGREYPWPRPERCPRCGHGRLWGHGFVSAYFDDYALPLWLRRYRCPLCRLILRLRPTGYFQRFQASVETIRQSLAYRFYHHLWPPGSSRQRQGHWLRAFLRKVRFYLGLSGWGAFSEAFDALISLGINPISRSF
jgi:hypothetical protein